MVGVPRSKGCSTCVSRRVKCDEARPACVRCQVYGQACPGYVRVHKFNDETLRLQHRYVQKRKKLASSSPSSDLQTFPHSHVTIIPTTTTTITKNDLGISPEKVLEPAGVRQLLNHIAADPTDIPAPIVRPPVSEQSQLLSRLLSSVRFDKSLPGDCFFFDTWLSQLPSKGGDNSALDAAVRTLYLHHAATMRNDPLLFSESNIQYSRALRLMVDDLTLANSKDTQSSDLLCATLVCVLYEFYAHTTRDAWVQHALGAARLIRIQNLSPSQSPFLKTLFFVFRSVLLHACSLSLCLPAVSYGTTLQVLIRKTDCFLDNVEWREAMASNDGYGQGPMNCYILSDQFNVYLIKLPRLINEAKAAYGSTDGRVGAAKFHLLTVKSSLIHWYERLKKVGSPRTLVPSLLKYRIYENVYEYDNMHMAALNSNYFMCILAINRALAQFSGSFDFNIENVQLVDEICMTVEYCQNPAVRPPFQILFALMLAFHSTTDIQIRDFLTWAVVQISSLMQLSTGRKNSMMAILNKGPDRMELCR